MVSFIIPVLNEGASIAALLQRLRRDFEGSELIVVDGGSTDTTATSAMKWADLVLVSPPGRAQQMNLGAQAAKHAVLLFLHADSEPQFVARELQSVVAPGFGWSFCRVALASNRLSLRVITWFINKRSRLTSIATGDQLFMIEKSLFDSLGGFADIPLMEDVELSGRLRQFRRATRCDLVVATSARRWEKQGVAMTVLRMWSLRLAFYLGVSPDKLWNHYYGRAALHAEASRDAPR